MMLGLTQGGFSGGVAGLSFGGQRLQGAAQHRLVMSP